MAQFLFSKKLLEILNCPNSLMTVQDPVSNRRMTLITMKYIAAESFDKSMSLSITRRPARSDCQGSVRITRCDEVIWRISPAGAFGPDPSNKVHQHVTRLH